jgi:beta-xylosidase
MIKYCVQSVYLFVLFMSGIGQSILAQQTPPKKEPVSHPAARVKSNGWQADRGDGTYQNPILHADYSDPDVIRVGKDYYLTSSSFNQVPGLPILHSNDLVNWKLIGHALPTLYPIGRFDTVVHGGGVWAPAIRHHQGMFYIFYPDPDTGIWMVKARDPKGPWTTPVLVKAAKGWIDPCPFWDEDGNAYLISARAASRSGVKSVLVLNRMAADGSRLLDEGVLVFDGHAGNPTVEGPKLYKRNGFYYIFAPAGGVGTGWQLVLRSKQIRGPYEVRKVLEQGGGPINGPHQGAWVDTELGEHWFIHFQDKDAYGRVVHLQPMRWLHDWPVIGQDPDGDGMGEPVTQYKKPRMSRTYPIQSPTSGDEFNSATLGLQWQWPAVPRQNQYLLAGPAYGFIRLFGVPVQEEQKNAWKMPQMLLQKFPAPDFSATTKCTFHGIQEGDEVGLMVMGLDYTALVIRKEGDGYKLYQAICRNAESGSQEEMRARIQVPSQTLFLRVKVLNQDSASLPLSFRSKAENSRYGDALCQFSYSTDGVEFNSLGEPFLARKGKWIGTKLGVFARRIGAAYQYGFADFDWFRIE